MSQNSSSPTNGSYIPASGSVPQAGQPLPNVPQPTQSVNTSLAGTTPATGNATQPSVMGNGLAQVSQPASSSNAQPSAQPELQQKAPMNDDKKKKMIILGLILVAVLLLGAAAVFFMSSANTSSSVPVNTNTRQNTPPGEFNPGAPAQESMPAGTSETGSDAVLLNDSEEIPVGEVDGSAPSSDINEVVDEFKPLDANSPPPPQELPAPFAQ